ADAAPPLRAGAPVVPFIRRRHLAARLQQLVQEVPMSRIRLTSAAVTFAALIAIASWATVSAMPLQTQAAASDKQAPAPAKQAAASDKSEPGDKPLDASKLPKKPKLIHEVKAVYPQEAKDAKIQGDVEVDIRIAKDGTVADAKVSKSIPALDKAAVDAVK